MTAADFSTSRARPFPLPTDLPRDDGLRNYYRDATAVAIAHQRGARIDQVARELFGDGEAEVIMRADIGKNWRAWIASAGLKEGDASEA